VDPEVTGLSERLIALLTAIGFFPGEDAIMFLEVTSSNAGIFTQLTCKWLLPAVGHFMSLQVPSQCNGIVTL
jgi:hypothetical protein